MQSKQFFHTYDIQQGFLSDILEKIQSYYWVSTEEHEFMLVPLDGGPAILLSEQYPALKYSSSILTDQEGAVWIGTQFGVYRFKLKQSRFKVFLHDKKMPVTNETFSIRGMAVVEDTANSYLWAIVEQLGPLWRIDLSTGEEREILSKVGARWGLGKTKQNEILCAGLREMLRLNGKTGEVVQEYSVEMPADVVSVWLNVEDKYGKIWFDNYETGKLSYFKDGRQTSLENWTGNPGMIYTYQFLEDETENAWVATSKGLFQLNLQSGKVIQRFWKDGTGKFYLPFDHVHHMVKAEDGTFWLATSTGGLIHWTPEHGIIERFTRADGLPGNTIYAVYPDDHGNFWLPTDYGITVLNRSTKKVRTYTINDGLSNNEFNRIAHCCDEAGNFYFGTLNGVTAFHPDDFVADTAAFQPRLVITNFQQLDGASNQLVDKLADLLNSNTIIMRPGDNLFQLEFSLLAFEDINFVQYGYRLEGVDKEWIYQKGNTIRISKLPYGNHLLMIKGQTAEGMWSSHILRINVRVLKPFYLQVWFILLTIAIVMACIFYYYKQREKTLKDRQAELERVVKERTATIEQQKEQLQSLDIAKTRFFANVSHELRTPLTLLLGPINTLLKKKDATPGQTRLLEIAQRSGGQLHRLINEILDLRKLETGSMTLKTEPTALSAFFRNYVAQFESLAERRQIDLNFHANIQVDQAAEIDREKCRQILYNLLSNAFKFTPNGGKISVDLNLNKENQLALTVSDSGSGIHPDDLPHVFNRFYQTNRPDKAAEGGTGIGLNICAEYARLFGGDIKVE
ncbi:MAG: hypothetical protein KDI30_05225, partial [Pseudomonadales bacterium]|nr:hypothetical protein [Pseudomonadales bacterium]